MRVAVTQFATSLYAEENLATCIRMINEVAVCEPSLIVLPGFCNTQLLYTDHNQAWNEALSINGPFIKAIAEQAKKHNCYIVLNVTLQRDTVREFPQNSLHDFSESKQDGVIQPTVKSNISITSCLFSPLGDFIHQESTKTLAEHEKGFVVGNNKSDNNNTSKVSEVVTTPFGKIGFLTSNDDITFEASRELSLSGAQLLCSSMSSFTLNQSNLYGPTRACENKVFLAAANKIGLLVPPEHPLQKNNSEKYISQEKNATSQEHLVGVGQSQIVSPDGKVLAKITHNEEGFTFADIDLGEAGINSNNKCRPDGTELIRQLRPELYQALTQPTKLYDNCVHENKVPVTANIAIFATYKTNNQAIEDVCHYIENNLSDIIQLPELFFIADKKIINNAEQKESNRVFE